MSLLQRFLNPLEARGSPSAKERILALHPDLRTTLFYDPDTAQVPHALYVDHRGDFCARPDAGTHIESCGLGRVVEPFVIDETAIRLGAWDVPEHYEEETLARWLDDNAAVVVSTINRNLFAEVRPFRN